MPSSLVFFLLLSNSIRGWHSILHQPLKDWCSPVSIFTLLLHPVFLGKLIYFMAPATTAFNLLETSESTPTALFPKPWFPTACFVFSSECPSNFNICKHELFPLLDFLYQLMHGHLPSYLSLTILSNQLQSPVDWPVGFLPDFLPPHATLVQISFTSSIVNDHASFLTRFPASLLFPALVCLSKS